MGVDGPRANMKHDFDTFLAHLRNGKDLAYAVIWGDDLQVQSACKSLVDLLVPKEQRGFNLERFDGRSAAWDQIESSLMTPPFLPGKKLVWVENAPYFFSREYKSEVGERVLQLWRDGKRDDAGKFLLDLLALEGWSAEQWERLEPRSFDVRPLTALFGADDQEAGEAAVGLIAYCKGRGLELGERRSPEQHGLVELLERGMPPWDFLLLSPSQVDRRTRIYKKFEELGAVFYRGFERDRNGKISRDSLREFIDRRLKRSGKTIEPKARELIVIRAGDELGTLEQEIEKLLLYVGEQTVIRVQDVEPIIVDQAEGWIFDLTRLIAARDATGALCQLARLGDHPLKLLGTIASEVRKLLSARQLMEGDLRGRWQRGMSYNQFQQAVLSGGMTLLTRNPYADYMCFQRAENFSLNELLSYVRGIHDADLRLKSSGNNPRLVLERLILHMCMSAPRSKSLTSRTGS